MSRAGPSLAGLGQHIRIAAIPEHKENEGVVMGQLRVGSETVSDHSLASWGWA